MLWVVFKYIQVDANDFLPYFLYFFTTVRQDLTILFVLLSLLFHQADCEGNLDIANSFQGASSISVSLDNKIRSTF